ncbi:hypothetical protein K458DRAFT_110179 [Lentithecium fluviatile CBS 122367]|uniref:Zn(2)-C6 fungal-type domain-containing protein n=1 Tax=Lentithecium fluviatile CBS 122367 TaxID=1168545 RepID=A0A6G1IQ01_9PLEO|nr:hypothetical protein K458DRAFT_110179 [Lentithecium fluviatile CBS 122367]
MRSQIACSKCRRSKVRCVNDGPGTQCVGCAKVGVTCNYTPSAANGPGSGIPKRRGDGPIQQTANGRSGEATSKRRKIAPLSHAHKDGASGSWDLLNPDLFTRQTWSELFAIFEQHFATDIPFLHAQRFTEQLRKADVRSLMDPFASLLLAFLALTTPFHDTFVQHPWHGAARRSTPAGISEMYADAARARLVDSNAYSRPTIETTQALLMLGVHEWRSRQGQRCFLTIGSAINCAEFLGCHEQLDLEDEEDAWSSPPELRAITPKSEQPLEDQFIDAEIKRRTYWCCYILDSYVSSGERRRQKVRSDEIKIQLPCSQRAFDLGTNVKTMTLCEDADQFKLRQDRYSRQDKADNDMEIEWEGEKEQEALTWFIKALKVYRRVMHWVCNITRRKEKSAPWDSASKFYGLTDEMMKLKQSLHRDVTLTDRNTGYHIHNRTSRSYVQLHSVLALCDMALHREYIAYLPWDQPKPMGPIGGPSLADPPQETWWENNARSCFQAARSFLDLVAVCKEEGVLVETSIVGFAMFYVFQIVIWCRTFWKQDQDNCLCTTGGDRDKLLLDNAKKAKSILIHMQERLPMSRFWLQSCSGYLRGLDKLQKEQSRTGGSPESNGSNSTADNHTDLLHWAKIEKELKEFQTLKDENNDVEDDQNSIDLRIHDASGPNSPDAVKVEKEERDETTPESAPPPPHTSFTTINGNGSRGGGAPKVMDGPPTPAVTSYPQHYHNGGVHAHAFHSPSNGLPPPAAYHPTESKERDSLHQQMYNHNINGADPPPMPHFPPVPGDPHVGGAPFFPIGWQQPYFGAGFASGNDTENAMLPFSAAHGFAHNYENAGNNSM